MRIMNPLLFVMCMLFVLLSSEAQTRKGLSESDISKINEINQVAMKAAVDRDFDTWAAIFLDDAVLYPPNQPAVEGRGAIRAWLEKLPTIKEFTLNNVKVEGREDLAYVLGKYTMTMEIPGAPGPVQESGKFVTVLRKQSDGNWLGAVDMFSSDLPAAPPPPK